MKKKWKPAAWVLVGFGVAAIVLITVPNWMGISQFCYDVGQRNPWVIVGTGIGFIWLFVHLFWRWKNVWKWIKERYKEK